MSDPHVPSPTPVEPAPQVPPTQHDSTTPAQPTAAQPDAAQPTAAQPDAAQPTVPQYAAAGSDVPPYAPPAASGLPPYAAPAASEIPPYAAPAPAARGKNGFGLAALIIGIVALIGAFIPVVNYVSGFIAFVGLALGIVGLVLKNRVKGMAIAGTVTSGVALVLSIVLAIAYSVWFLGELENEIGNDFSTSSERPVAEAPVTDEEETDAEAAVGTRENPAPIGTTVVLTGTGGDAYEITLGAPTLNASEAVVAANMFNDEPEAGFQYAMVPVTVAYTGSATGNPWIDIEVEFVSAAGTTHRQMDTMSVAPEPRFMDINELHPGGSGTGNIAIMIPTEDAELGTWAISPLFGDETFFMAAQ
jgi:Na+-transporting methylmalonyl-CoA/oxaloacetate decarboxylase gamma subunit